MKEIRNFEKMKTIAFVLKKILHVFTWILVSVGILLIIGEAAVLMAKGESFTLTDFYNGNMTFAIEGWFEYNLAAEVGNTISLKPVIVVLLPAIIIIIIIAIFIVLIIVTS